MLTLKRRPSRDPRPVDPASLAARRLLQETEGRVAMAEYRRDERLLRERTARLRAERLQKTS